LSPITFQRAIMIIEKGSEELKLSKLKKGDKFPLSSNELDGKGKAICTKNWKNDRCNHK